MNSNQSTSCDTPPVSYALGLDIGIASVGWAVLGQKHIIDLGVRAFNKAETADKGESLNLQRRTARLMRRRLARRAWRLKKLARLLKHHGLIATQRHFEKQPSYQDSTWELRKEGLDRKLTPEEWARVIYHICKHRGFHWISSAEEFAEPDNKSEGGKVKKGLAENRALMESKNYRTAAEMLLAEFPQTQRNKKDDYSKALSRVLLDAELERLFAEQRVHGNPFSTVELEIAVRGKSDERGGIFWEQKPALAGKDLLTMLGKCTFERQEYRAPKASFTAEKHVWLTRLNNLRIIVDGTTRPLNNDERKNLIDLPYIGAEKFTYKHLRTALIRGGLLPESMRFSGLAYPSASQQEIGNTKNPEDQVVVQLSAWHALKKSFKKANLGGLWEQISTDALEGKPDSLDNIAWVLSVYKDDTEVREELRKLALPGGEALTNALLSIRFDKFHALSLKALRRIVPLMHTGLRYDEAVASIEDYRHHSQRFATGAGTQKYLPPFYEPQRKYATKKNAVGSMVFKDGMDIPRNPVVLRALNQARKVVNAIVKQYGAPTAVHIEMARDLSRPKDERDTVMKLQKTYQERNQQAREHFADTFGRTPKAAELEKWQLCREQQSKCAYSLQPLDCARVIDDPSYTQVDHVLPYSRSYDDSKNNKVLVLSRENQNKGNRTPYEYLSGSEDSQRWLEFVAWVNSNKAYRQAKRSRLLRKDFGKDEAQSFRDRNLNDTRYICKFFKNYVEQHLQLAPDSKHQRCIVVNGQLTAFLRARWGLIKNRDESDRHHALDAAIVAACSHSMVQALADHARKKELQYLHEGIPDPETGEIINPSAHQRLALRFPEPWAHFRHELLLRVRTDDTNTLRTELERLGTYPADALQKVRPLWVSRAPQRRNLGSAHKDTIYGQPNAVLKQGGATEKIALTALTIKDLDNLIDPHRNAKLYEAIRTRLQAHGGKGDKAFDPQNPLYKPDKNGNPTGPLVRTVTAVIPKISGIPIRGGLARNDSMARIDVFTKAGKFHLVPVYVHHYVTGMPQHAVVANKDESEWTFIDDSFTFAFSLHPNDLVKVTTKKDITVGYFAGCDRSTGNINLWAHDRHNAVGKDGLIRSIGVKTALALEKFDVDVLGHIYPAKPESRRGMA